MKKSMLVCWWNLEYGCDQEPIWETGCNNGFQFTNDGPEENEFNFCPYCGGELRIIDE